jgi:hypothetical protein
VSLHYIYIIIIALFPQQKKSALIGRFGVSIFLFTLIGLIFEGAGARDYSDLDGLSAHFGALIMVSVGAIIGSAQPVMLALPLERPVFLREYTTGTYDCVPYFISKGLVRRGRLSACVFVLPCLR